MAAALVAGACAAGTTSESALALPPLDVEIAQQMSTHEAIAWSASRPLVWTDFRGTPPTGGSVGALTAYSLFYGLRCTRDVFQFQVTTAFLPRDSWVKPSVVANAAESRRTLEHEQTHFDISELYARRLRKFFSDRFRPCDQPLDHWRGIAQQYTRDEAEAQGRYDGETRHGLVADRQQVWNKDVAAQLAELANFSR